MSPMGIFMRDELVIAERSIPEPVLKLKLETEFLKGCIKHRRRKTATSIIGPNAIEREEIWDIGPNIGAGASSSVRFEELRQNQHHDHGTPQYRAVKVIKKAYGKDKGWDYTRELTAIARFSERRYARYFVHTHGWFENADEIFIAMEFFPLGDLGKVTRSEPPLSELETGQIIKQVTEGIGFMHENGFVHRDLKPNNILVWTRSPRWIVRLADFGISKQGVEDDSRMTEIGTPGYVAPEVLRIFHVNEFSVTIDIWAIGIITVELLLHRRLFRYMGDLFNYVRGDTPLDLQTGIPGRTLSAACRDFIEGLLTPDPAGRPRSAAVLSHQWLTGSTPSTISCPRNGTPRANIDITMVSSPSGAFSVPSVVEKSATVQMRLEDRASTELMDQDATIIGPATPMSMTTQLPSSLPTDLGMQSSLTAYNGSAFDRNLLLPAFRNINLEKARYYILRSTSAPDSESGIAFNTWTSGSRQNKIVDKGYLTTGGNVLLIFSLVGSQKFYGVARMLSRVDWDNTDEHWEDDIWKGRYDLDWICLNELPFARVKHVPVSSKTPNWRAIGCYDGTEISPQSAYELFKAFSTEAWEQQARLSNSD
ncbi:hypothetical protein TWF694_002648 [Orbilia ellipsospora]|uniref:mitogen-activated protein kinase kinase n=1 Tax=Orbilia ellipsospora TaxID=2528407 RepID=A0AAV9X3V0_9PEZI